MAAKLGVRAPALVVAVVATLSLASVGEPATADDTLTTSTTVDSTSSTTTSTPETTSAPTPAPTVPSTGSTRSNTPEPTTTTTTATPALVGSAGVVPQSIDDGMTSPLGPIASPAAAGSGTPSRGTQVQLQPPPPPPTLPAESELPANSGQGRRAVYSKSLQRVWAVDEFGTVLLNTRVSGRLDPTDPSPGTYSVYSRSLRTYAVHNPSISWSYMVRFAHGGRGGNIGFHEIPYQYGRPVQTVDQLGQALSGGCVRMASADAIWMWNWAQVGTTVVVLA